MSSTKTIYSMFFIIVFGLIAFISIAASSSNYESTEVTDPDKAKVIIYGTPQCHYCKKARKLLSHHDIPFFEYDISSNAEARAIFSRLEGRGTPLIIIGKDIIKGYDETTIMRLLNINQQSKGS